MGIKRLKISLLKTGILALFTLIISSCNLGIIHTEFRSLNNAVWDKDNVVEFQIIPKDSTLAYNWFIHIRNTQDYPYSNLFLITELSSENKIIETDTIEYTMANPDGSWKGISSGSLVEHKIPYLSQKSFSSTASYSLRIKQAMRALGSIEPLKELKGVSDIGYSIEMIE